jgi:hypothetical protein
MKAAWILQEWLARLLEPAEREAVLGDLIEAGEGPWQSLSGIAGLVFRRQAGLWGNWRPWVAALGISIPTSFMLMGASVMVCSGLVTLAAAGTSDQLFAAKVEIVAVQALLLASWSWTCGYLVGSMSRRTVWFSIISYCWPCLFCLSRFRIESLSRLSLLLFVLPAAGGLWQGLRARGVAPRFAASAAAIITALALVTRIAASKGTGGFIGWIGSLVLTWPAWYLAAASLRSATKGKRTEQSAFKPEQHELG